MDKLILSELTNGLNTVWMLLAAMLVFFMQRALHWSKPVSPE